MWVWIVISFAPWCVGLAYISGLSSPRFSGRLINPLVPCPIFGSQLSFLPTIPTLDPSRTPCITRLAPSSAAFTHGHRDIRLDTIPRTFHTPPIMAFTAAQRQRAIGLYKRLLRTSRKTFDGDSVAVAAARDETRRRFRLAAQETDAAKIDEGLKMGDEIVSVLRQNVVQGKWRQDRDAYGKLTPSKHWQPVDSRPAYLP